MLRYVVLHHTGIENAHYDLMLELTPGSALSTWRVPHWPPSATDRFQRLADHRGDYLEYEGPVYQNRGEVKRIAAGVFQTIRHDSNELVIALENIPELTLSLADIQSGK